jgi:DNA polymerase-3 subunit delta'
LAQHFAQRVLCERAPQACGQCRPCRQALSGEHPDLRLLVPDPELKSGQISVDQVRELSAWLALSSHEGRGSCAVIHPADAMNRQAANALLKTLEEPRTGAHLVLLTTQPARLPATVRSRCQVLRLAAPNRAAALDFLDAQSPGHHAEWEAALDVLGAAPLEALESDRAQLRAIADDTAQLLQQASAGRLDVVRHAAQWSGQDMPLRLRALEQVLTAHALHLRPLPATVATLKTATALKLLDEVRELQRLLTTSVNRPLAMEQALWHLSAALS